MQPGEIENVEPVGHDPLSARGMMSRQRQELLMVLGFTCSEAIHHGAGLLSIRRSGSTT